MASEAAQDIGDQDVFGGVDSHADTVHVAVIGDNGGHLADAEFTTTAAGYAAALAFLDAHGHVIAIGVEGTSSYGAGFTRAARSHGHTVVEANRPDRAERRLIGKSDPIDAYAAARAALSGRASSVPKDGTVAGIRALHNAARSAVKARTAAVNQITRILFTAPESIRAKYGQLKGTDRTDTLARLRSAGDAVHAAVLAALKILARRVKEPTGEHEALTKALDSEVTVQTPGLRAAYGVGPDTAAQLLITAGRNPERMRTGASFAALCGAAPVPASSGRPNRHRLSRGGDRAANRRSSAGQDEGAGCQPWQPAPQRLRPSGQRHAAVGVHDRPVGQAHVGPHLRVRDAVLSHYPSQLIGSDQEPCGRGAGSEHVGQRSCPVLASRDEHAPVTGELDAPAGDGDRLVTGVDRLHADEMIAQVLAPVAQVVHRDGIGDLEDDPGAYGSGQVGRDVEAVLLLVVVSDLQSGGAIEGVADYALAGREFLLLGHQCLKLGRDLLLLGVLQVLQERLEAGLPRCLLAQARPLRLAGGVGLLQNLRSAVEECVRAQFG